MLQNHFLDIMVFPGLVSVAVHVLLQKWAFIFKINRTVGEYSIDAFTPLSFLPIVCNKHCPLNIGCDCFFLTCSHFLSFSRPTDLAKTLNIIMDKDGESVHPCLMANFREMLSASPPPLNIC